MPDARKPTRAQVKGNGADEQGDWKVDSPEAKRT